MSVFQHDEFDNHEQVAFFKDDERRGRPYETWTGTLGLSSVSPATHRVDPESPSHASREPISTPKVPVRAPHFAVPVAADRFAGHQPVG